MSPLASVYAGSNCIELKGPEIMEEMIVLRRLINMCFLFSKKPFPVFLELVGFSQEDVLIEEPTVGMLKPAHTILRDECTKSFLVLIRGTHSMKDTLTAATAWEPFRYFIPEDERNCFITAYSKRLTSSDTDVQAEAAKRWTMWEMMTAHLIQNHENIKRGDDDKFSLAFARIENHYFVNKGFLSSDSYLLDNVDKIRHIKAFIVQGRYDVCCPMMSAWDLHKAWPKAEFKVDKING